jgi:hypothetical protein
MSISHRADDHAANAYRAAYAGSLEPWPTAMRRRFVDTPFGQTHVVESGCPSGEPVVLIHAASTPFLGRASSMDESTTQGRPVGIDPAPIELAGVGS